ncbi:MAG TPA: hypothetical protein DD381_11330 [Lentisphaeria bacterium]|nr:MAG: hypothetical protein A2X47_12785 [Lentisphaerae bacterium GWF2_38_69]HBM16921.1 hypothetical protein [Lentisphaeria bacterium]
MNSTETRQLKIVFDNNDEIICPLGTSVKNIMSQAGVYNPEVVPVAALVNNRVETLDYPLETDSEISLLTISGSHGWRVYRDSLAFLLSKASYECYPDNALGINHSLGSGFYCSFDGIFKEELPAVLARIESHMRRDIDSKIPIVRNKIRFKDALDYFSSKERNDKLNLLKFKNDPKISVYECNSFIDLAHGVLADNSGVLKHFNLIPYEDGFVLQFPEKELPVRFSKFKKQKSLFNIFKSYKKWGQTIGIKTAGDLNELILRDDLKEIIDIEEAFQEKKLAEIADEIYSRKEHVKWVLIAGPSSSGKTTFSHRLSTQMKVNGIKPVIISGDNYFVDRVFTPKDEKGNYDYEHLEAIDLPLLYRDLEKLDKGEEIEIPTYDFIEGKKKWLGKKVSLKENEMAVIEGIHSLNPAMTEPLAKERKYKIYINALTQLNLDFNNRISTTDCRLIRRVIRDHRTRGFRALDTMKMWHSVREGEKKWIFPFQDYADTVFSSALNYELFVLKPLVEPLFAEVKQWDESYQDARRIQEFLSAFVPAPSEDVPRRSILREFIGGGILG